MDILILLLKLLETDKLACHIPKEPLLKIFLQGTFDNYKLKYFFLKMPKYVFYFLLFVKY